MNSTVKSVLIAALVGGLTATAAHAGKGCGMDHHRHRGFDSEQRINRLADRLELSAEQRDKVRAIVDKSRPALRAVHDKMRDNRKAMHALMQEEKVSEAANAPSMARGPRLDPIRDSDIRKLADARGKLVAEMTVLRARMKSDIHAVLTPEQRDKLKQHSEQHRRHSSGLSPAGTGPGSPGQDS